MAIIKDTWYYGEPSYATLVNGTTQNAYQVRIAYKLNSQNSENNTSNVTRQLQVRSVKSNFGTYGYEETPEIDYIPLYPKSFDMRNTNVWQNFGEYTSDLLHNSDGTLTYHTIGHFITTATNDYSLSHGTATADFELPSIARGNTINVVDTDIGSPLNIIINKRDASYSTTLSYKFEGQTEYTTIVEKTQLDSYNWVVPDSFYNLIPNSTSGVCTILARTFSNDAEIGDGIIATFNAKVVEEVCKPIVSNYSATDLAKCTALTHDPIRWIQYVSKPTVSWQVEAQKGASIVMQEVSDGRTVTQDVTSPYTFPIPTVSFVFRFYDSRDYMGALFALPMSTTPSIGAFIVRYEFPTINDIVAKRADGDLDEVKATFSGTWWNDYFDANNTELNNVYVTFRYRKHDSQDEWIEVNTPLAITIDNNTFSAANISLGSLFDYRYSWDIQLKVTDRVDEPQYFAISPIPKAIPAYNVYEDSDGNYYFNVNGRILSNYDPVDKLEVITGEEIATNEYCDGKRVFLKRIYIPTLPNKAEQSYQDELTHTNILMIRSTGWASNTDGSYQNTLEGLDTRISLSPNGLTIKTNDNYSAYSAYVNLYYVYKN